MGLYLGAVLTKDERGDESLVYYTQKPIFAKNKVAAERLLLRKIPASVDEAADVEVCVLPFLERTAC